MKEAIQKYREVRHKWEELESLSEAPGSSFMRKIDEKTSEKPRKLFQSLTFSNLRQL